MRLTILHNGAPITDVTPGGVPVYVPGFEMAPAERQNAVQGLPGRMLQIRADGVDIGNARPAVIDIVAEPGRILVTRGVGENAHVATLRALPSPGDPDFESVILLLHADSGTDTAFIDSSQYGHSSSSTNGIGQIGTGGKFGGYGTTNVANGSSVRLVSTTTGATFAVDEDTSMTFEGWHYFQDVIPGTGASYNLLNALAGGVERYSIGCSHSFSSPNEMQLRITINNSVSALTAGQDIPTPFFPFNEWFFWSLVYNGATNRAYIHINGVPRLAMAFGGSFSGNLTEIQILQDSGSSAQGSQRFDEIRVTWQIARYTEAETYAVPTTPFPNLGP